MSAKTEYRVVWQREGQTKKRRIMQTVKGARRVAEVQESARDDMEWLPQPLPPITYGPVIESREVGDWTTVEARDGASMQTPYGNLLGDSGPSA